jgi:ectoine hydroxylase-related dioxygenase (phytanoyl-CoA dioxygenase family)
MQDGIIQKQPIPEELLQPLKEISNVAELQRSLEEEGYVFLRGVLNREEVLAARQEVFRRLEEVEEIEPPALEGIATGRSKRLELESDRGKFWQSVSEGQALRHVTHGPQIREVMNSIFGEPSRPHDLMYLRPTAVGCSTNFHYDYPFFAGNSERILTAWIPLGDIPVTEGPLTVVEGSNRFSDLLDPIRAINFQDERSNELVQNTAYEKQNEIHPISLVRERNTRMLTAFVKAGDLMVFSGFLLHGSLDNHSPIGRVRLSCDVRYQPAKDLDTDERYFGSHPLGSNGGGYADMRGAKPLTIPG